MFLYDTWPKPGTQYQSVNDQATVDLDVVELNCPLFNLMWTSSNWSTRFSSYSKVFGVDYKKTPTCQWNF